MRIGAGIAAVLAAAAVCAAAPPADDFVGLFNAATAAYKERHYERMEQRLSEALALRPAHPTALYNLASAQALRGKTGAALKTLQTLADMGLSFDPAADADFAEIAANPRFKELSARFAGSRTPAGNAMVMFRVFKPDFIPEGLAYDPDSGAYFLSGARAREIVRFPRGGLQAENFVAPGSGGLWAPLGMQADPSRRLLWVATAAIPEMRHAQADELGRSAIIAFDLDSGQRKRRYALPDDGAEHLLGDLLVLRGTVYATDSKAGTLYALDTSRGKYRALTKPGQLASPQGLAVDKERKVLYVADYTRGLFAWDLQQQTLQRLSVAPGISVYGIDGLYWHDGNLVAVQNGIRPHRVVRFRLDATGRRVVRAYVLAANLPEFDEPTLGVVVGDRFSFVANSQWHRFDERHRLPPREHLRSPVVLRVSLDD